MTKTSVKIWKVFSNPRPGQCGTGKEILDAHDVVHGSITVKPQPAKPLVSRGDAGTRGQRDSRDQRIKSLDRIAVPTPRQHDVGITRRRGNLERQNMERHFFLSPQPESQRVFASKPLGEALTAIELAVVLRESDRNPSR